MAIVDPLSCGFAKVITFGILSHNHGLYKRESEAPNEFKARLLRKQFDDFNDIFGSSQNDRFTVTYKQFSNNFQEY